MAPEEKPKTVAVVDSIWNGHHPMFFGQFAASFLRAGARVVGLCPEPTAAAHETREALGAHHAGLNEQASFRPIATARRGFLRGRYESDPLRTLMRWVSLGTVLAESEQALGVRIDLVYFTYLDNYLRFAPWPRLPGKLMQRAWSGLYFRTHHLAQPPSARQHLRVVAKGDHLMRSPWCQQIGTLDERLVPTLAAYTGRPVQPYPDVTHSALPATPTPQAQEVLRQARGRTIVGMIGLERRKGLLNLLRTAELARQTGEPLYFVAAGTCSPDGYSSTEWQWLRDTSAQVQRGEIDNLHFDVDAPRIADEADYNSLFHTFGVAWIAYEAFEGSSGMLSKAAAFNIPCIATDFGCIGERVKTYQMGLALPDTPPPAALQALHHLAQGHNLDGQPLNPRYAAYRADHSVARLDGLTQGLLETLR